MRTILILTLCFCGFYMNAQDVFNRQLPPTAFTEDIRAIKLAQQHIMDKARSKGSVIKEDEKIVGTAYLEKGFQPGQVFYNETSIGDYLLRYNVYNEEFEILNTDESMSAVSKTSEVNVKVGLKKYVFKYYKEDDGRSKFGYFEVMSNMSDKAILLKKNKKLFSESRKAVTSFDVNRPARFVTMETYYLLFSDKEIVKIRLQNSFINRFFKKRGVNVKSFIRENMLDVKDISDLKKVIDYYNDNASL